MAPHTRTSVTEALDRLGRQDREDRLTHLEVIPPRPGRASDWPAWVDERLVAAWRSRGIDRPWTHLAARVPGLVGRGLLAAEPGPLRLTLAGRLLADGVVRDLVD